MLKILMLNDSKNKQTNKHHILKAYEYSRFPKVLSFVSIAHKLNLTKTLTCIIPSKLTSF